MSQIQITLTPSESKRFIAKAVAALPEVRGARRKGTGFSIWKRASVTEKGT